MINTDRIVIPTLDQTWIRTYTGRQFWPMNPCGQDLHIHDIAHALALQCRYTGHTRCFYSVAQHCCLVADNLATFDQARQGLMHDASEAYLTDIATPVKRQLSEYGPAEERLMHVIAHQFGFDWPILPRVKEMDRILLMTEQRDLMNYINPSFPDLQPLPGRIQPWGPERAEWEFLQRFRTLFLTTC